MKVLITGGSGYLGQHLLATFAAQRSLEVAYTYCRNPLGAGAAVGAADSSARAFQVDLTDAASVEACVDAFGPEVVIHTAAQASPAAAANDPAASAAVNAPAALLAALAALSGPRPLLVFLSTDQVYGGLAAGEGPYPSSAPARPVNAYGDSKAAFEAMLARGSSADGSVDGSANGNGTHPFFVPFVVVRSSNLVGPPAPFTGGGKFLQWLERELNRSPDANPSRVVELFADEVRSFAHVHDVCAALLALVRIWEAHGPSARVSPGRSDSPSGGPGEGPGSGPGAGPGSAGDGASKDQCDGEGKRTPTTVATTVAATGAAYGPEHARLRAVAGGWGRRGATYNMGGPEGLSRVGLAHALCEARPVGTPGACSLRLADGATQGVAPSSRAALDGKLGYRSPLDISMDSSALAAVTGVVFRPMRVALALAPALVTASSGEGHGPGGGASADGCGSEARSEGGRATLLDQVPGA